MGQLYSCFPKAGTVLCFLFSLLFNSCEGLYIPEKEYCERTSPDPTCGVSSWICSGQLDEKSTDLDKQRYTDCVNRVNTQCFLEELTKYKKCKNKSKERSSLLLKNPEKAIKYDPETDDYDTSGL